jgi:hypothetical protein
MDRLYTGGTGWVASLCCPGLAGGESSGVSFCFCWMDDSAFVLPIRFLRRSAWRDAWEVSLDFLLEGALSALRA